MEAQRHGDYFYLLIAGRPMLVAQIYEDKRNIL